MKLRAIRLSEFRRYAQPVELAGLTPGLNLFIGPNEAGKSTVAAAVRAAFLERHKTTKVAGFAPYGMSGARPTVELDFDMGGRAYSLRKSFLSRARCELTIDGVQRLEGEQAEDELARLLGFAYSGKGQSRPEHGGIPGLLWVQQGSTGSLEPMQHAAPHLREALGQVSGELASADGDRLLRRVAAERGELLDARGKPRGVYRAADERVAQALEERDRCQAAHEAYEQALDTLGTLQRAHAADEREQPWLEFERKANAARARQQAISQEKAGLDLLLRERRQLDSTMQLLLEQLRRDQGDEDEAQALTRELAEADQLKEAGAQALAAARLRHNAAGAAVTAARAAFDSARLAAEQRDVAVMLERQAVEVRRLELACERARALAADSARLRMALERLQVAESDLDELRKLTRQRDDLAVRRAAMATRLQFRLPAATLELDGERLSGEGERLLTGVARLTLADGGSLTIVPGGTDLTLLAEHDDSLRARQERVSQRLGVVNLEAAEARWLQWQAAQRETETAERELAIHAPEGLAALEQTLAESGALQARLQQRLNELGTAGDTVPERDQTALQTDLKAAEAALAQAEEQATTLQQQLHATASEVRQLSVRLGAVRQRLDDSAESERRQERNRRLTEGRSERTDLDRRIAQTEARIDAHQPAVVDQDIERFERSARIAHDAYHQRQREMLLLQGRLDEAGALGTGESLAQSIAHLEYWVGRRDGLRRRAQALELLHQLLQERRDMATQRLQAPLSQRLAHYLRLLFPDAGIRLDEALAPGGLVRAGRVDEVADLSFGTQEQLGILVRFAYADLLQEAGRPTLLILDDALVHTDDARREWMKRALFDAAARHQILMFTCHAHAWKDLGVAQRELPA